MRREQVEVASNLREALKPQLQARFGCCLHNDHLRSRDADSGYYLEKRKNLQRERKRLALHWQQQLERARYEAQQAEVKLKRDVFEGKYGKQFGTMPFADFVGDPDGKDDQFGQGTFLEWSKTNKRSWKHDRFRVRALLDRTGVP